MSALNAEILPLLIDLLRETPPCDCGDCGRPSDWRGTHPGVALPIFPCQRHYEEYAPHFCAGWVWTPLR